MENKKTEILAAIKSVAQDIRPVSPAMASPEERRRDRERRGALRLLGVFLTFLADLPLYLKHILPDRIDDIQMWIGLMFLVAGMASFAAISLYDN
jgi:hypothetical protein